MAYQPPSIEPDSLVAGDTWSWTKQLADYPAGSGWTLSYSFTAYGQDVKIATATASAPDYLVTISAATSATFASGTWYWTARVTNGSETHSVGTGRFEVKPNPATSTADPRSETKKVLDAIRACILGAASTDDLSISVDGVALSRRTFDELRRMEAFYIARYNRELAIERAARGLGNRSVIKTRFTRPN
jgi:hypothetical protein